MNQKLALARIEAYSLLSTMPQAWVNLRLEREIIDALMTTSDEALNHQAGRQIVKDRCDELSLVPGQPDFSAEAWEGAQRGQRRVPSGDDLLTYDLGSAAAEADIERLTAALNG